MKKLSIALLVLSLSGCATGPSLSPKRDATAGLISRPDFQKAAVAAPEWVRESLKIITAYEAELSLK